MGERDKKLGLGRYQGLLKRLDVPQGPAGTFSGKEKSIPFREPLGMPRAELPLPFGESQYSPQHSPQLVPSALSSAFSSAGSLSTLLSTFRYANCPSEPANPIC